MEFEVYGRLDDGYKEGLGLWGWDVVFGSANREGGGVQLVGKTTIIGVLGYWVAECV
jgi:hypothetical protein